jgi:hypothetical protein
MSNAMICEPCNIDVGSITFNQPKALDNGSRMINMKLPNNTTLVFVTPQLNAPFGLTDWDNIKFSVDLSVGTGHDAMVLVEKIKEIESKIIDFAYENSMSWFKKKYTNREVVAELFTSAIKYPKDRDTGEISTKFPPTIKFTLPFRAGKFDCEAYNCSREPVEISKETIPKGSKINVIAQATTIWIAGNKFGVSLKAMQLKVALPKRITGFAFVDDSDEESDV